MSNTRIAIDWLTASVSNYTSPTDFGKLLGLEFAGKPSGRWGYKGCAVAAGGGIEVLYDGHSEGMGACLVLTGEGCRIIESLPFFAGWDSFLKLLVDSGAKFSRVDVSIDDLDGNISRETVKAAFEDVEAGGTAIVFRGSLMDYRRSTKGGVPSETWYLGARTSTAFTRIYTKGIQTEGGEDWLRFEFEFKAERATGIVHKLINGGWDAVKAAIRGVVEFKDMTHETTDRTRRRVASWWADLLGQAKSKWSPKEWALSSVEKLGSWVTRQVSPALALLVEIDGGSLEWVYKLLDEGKRRRSKRHIAMFDAFSARSLAQVGTGGL